MSSALSKRISAVEARRKPAAERYRLLVPRRDVTVADDADFDAKFIVQQTKLVAEARSIRTKEMPC